MFRILIIAALALNGTPAYSESALPSALPAAEESAAIASAEWTGLTIYRHDQAAAVATDAALALRQIKRDKRVRGWVTEDLGSEVLVTFLDETPAALYRVPVKDGIAGTVEVLKTPTPLSPYESGAANARFLALSAKFEPCSKRYNSVVLPGSTPSEDWVVYLVPGTTKSNIVPIGGTFRFGIKNSEVVSQRGFTRTCITLPSDPKAVALMITHLLDAVPTEAHVYWSIWAKKPMYVATPPDGTIWHVDGAKIGLVERKPNGE